MVRCPVCRKTQFVYGKGPAGTSCYYCGARWNQLGAEQENVIGLGSPASALRSMRQFHPALEETR